MKSPYIVAGPINGQHHVLRLLPGMTNVYSSVGCAPSEALAQLEAERLNAASLAAQEVGN